MLLTEEFVVDPPNVGDDHYESFNEAFETALQRRFRDCDIDFNPETNVVNVHLAFVGPAPVERLLQVEKYAQGWMASAEFFIQFAPLRLPVVSQPPCPACGPIAED